MLRTWLVTLASVAIVSAIPLAGLLLLRVDAARQRGLLPALASLAVGALLGGAFLHLLPEALGRSGDARPVFGWLLLGFLGFFLLERLLASRRRSERRAPPRGRDGDRRGLPGRPAGGRHHDDRVILHEVPQEIGDMGVLLYGGVAVRRAVQLNLLSVLPAVAGAILALMLGRRHAGLVDALLPLAAGAFTYVAASDLVPELRRDGRGDLPRQIGLILLGLGLMAVGARLD